MSAAIEVTPGGDAQHQPLGGAPIAGAMAQRRAQSADDNVIESSFDDESAAQTIKVIDADEQALSDDEAIAIVKEARAVIAKDNRNRAKRTDTAPSKKTEADYQRKCARVDAEIDKLEEPLPSVLLAVMSAYAPKKQTFYAMRAALRWRAIEKVKELLRIQAAMRLEAVRSSRWQVCVKALNTALRELKEIEGITLEAALEYSKLKAKRANSKKYVLPRLEQGWRDDFLIANNRSEMYRVPVLLLRHCGLRPVELENGVEAELVGQKVNVRILGGKVRDGRGQPWRKFSLTAQMLPNWFTALLQDGKKIFTVNGDNMRTHLARISSKLYPRTHSPKRKDIIISAYVFRHALVTDLYLQGWTTEEIAAILGESSAETVAWYGLRPRGASRPLESSAIIKDSVETARDIKSRDKLWLKGVKKNESPKLSK